MINGRLTAVEAAARLGVKPATLYSYVSRGLLGRERTAHGSTFDVHEVARLARSARHPSGSGRPPTRKEGRPSSPDVNDPVFVTQISLINDGRLYYRGLDAVELSRRRSFEEVATWLWTGAWPGEAEASPPWEVPVPALEPVGRALAGLPRAALPVERFMVAVVTASLCDEFRHDLNPAGVPVTGRGLLSVLAAALPGSVLAAALPGSVRAAARPGAGGAGPPPAVSLSERVWTGLSRLPLGPSRRAAAEAALVLAADHELAPSTLAARVAAAFRADPYAVVLTGLGPASGSWRSGSSGAPTEVEALLEEAAELGADRAIGERLRRRGEIPHGFGMPLYPGGDPRARELLERVAGIGAPDRHAVVERVVEVGCERGFPPPNMDLGLGALSFCGEMGRGSGQAISTLAKAAGWLAHAIEEYTDPTRFRSRADYVGPAPETAGDSSG